MGLSSLLRTACLALLGPLALACVVQTEPTPVRRGDVVTTGGTAPAPPVSTAPPSGSGSTGGGAPSSTPILVDVDTNQTMNASPGQGVGVFTEYTAGGHWHVWWTCDTNVNPQGSSCAFDVKISVMSGALSSVNGDQLAPADTLTSTPRSLDVVTTTSTGVAGVLFDTDKGAIITLDASVGGVHDGRFLFFVQAGKVNGGYAGTLTDPLLLEGSTP